MWRVWLEAQTLQVLQDRCFKQKPGRPTSPRGRSWNGRIATHPRRQTNLRIYIIWMHRVFLFAVQKKGWNWNSISIWWDQHDWLRLLAIFICRSATSFWHGIHPECQIQRNSFGGCHCAIIPRMLQFLMHESHQQRCSVAVWRTYKMWNTMSIPDLLSWYGVKVLCCKNMQQGPLTNLTQDQKIKATQVWVACWSASCSAVSLGTSRHYESQNMFEHVWGRARAKQTNGTFGQWLPGLALDCIVLVRQKALRRWHSRWNVSTSHAIAPSHAVLPATPPQSAFNAGWRGQEIMGNPSGSCWASNSYRSVLPLGGFSFFFLIRRSLFDKIWTYLYVLYMK